MGRLDCFCSWCSWWAPKLKSFDIKARDRLDSDLILPLPGSPEGCLEGLRCGFLVELSRVEKLLSAGLLQVTASGRVKGHSFAEPCPLVSWGRAGVIPL